MDLWWLAVLAIMLTSSRSVSGLLNATSIIVNPNDGQSIYPCYQVNHREQFIEGYSMGMWYVIEIIHHRQQNKQRSSHSFDICPQLNLYKSGQSSISLIWTEKEGDVHYTFKTPDPENNGFWIVWGKQTGSLLNKVYEQFDGSVQVIEAQPTRMVLTFCSFNRTHFSVIMVRNVTLFQDTHDTHRALINYGLPEISVQQTCKNKALSGNGNIYLPAFSVILSSALLSTTRGR